MSCVRLYPKKGDKSHYTLFKKASWWDTAIYMETLKSIMQVSEGSSTKLKCSNKYRGR